MTRLQLVALTLVLLGAAVIGSFGAVVGFVAGVVLGWLLWGRREDTWG